MNVKRAIVSFSIAALVPGVISIAMLKEGSPDVLSIIGLFLIFYLICLPLVFGVGFIALFFALKIKYGPIIVPPLAGCIVGVLFAAFMYAPGTEMQDKLYFVVDGFITAIVAAFIYFRPWFKGRVVR